MKFLVVEDDAALRNVIVRALAENGHVVDSAADGVTGDAKCADESYDAIVLDIMLPGRDGVEIVRAMREARIMTPVMFLTARTTEADTIAGLDAGADDYLRKPFGVGELLARLRSISRRASHEHPSPIGTGSVRYDPVSRRVTRNGRNLDLTSREVAFVEYFIRNAGRTVTRETIAAALWPSEHELGSNVIDVYVRRLRTKLHAAGERPVLHTLRGIGYCFEER